MGKKRDRKIKAGARKQVELARKETDRIIDRLEKSKSFKTRLAQ